MPASSPSTVGGPDTLRALQERAARALPAAYVEVTEGWWLRQAPGCSWWVGTVLPHWADVTGRLAHRVATVAEFYAARDATARFRISPGACPPGLDAFPAGRGYRPGSPMSLRTARTAQVREQAAAGAAPPVRLEDRPTDGWFSVWRAVHGVHGGSGAERDLLHRVERPSAYACATIGGEAVGVGRAVADTGWAGLFGMATLPGARGKGAARAVLAALAHWAAGQGADSMYLQVERDNAPAARLYDRAGFSELCAYHHRTAP
ncbi:GNAT family N-acetyltransferase [Streptomyces sp. PA03-6a]|nr:GNAT family N-acetyltransferase [Streptomyces sp. PA03-6a]